MPGIRLLAVVETQGESDVICSLLRAEGIDCRESGERSSGPSEVNSPYGGRREIFVGDLDFERAKELLEGGDVGNEVRGDSRP